MYEFRPPNPNECIILFIRHGEHEKQVIILEDRTRLLKTGEALDKMGVKLAKIVSSPKPRALRTGLITAEGAKQDPDVQIDPRLSDITSSSIDKDAMKAEAKKLGIEPEIHLLTGPKYSELMHTRGAEGANALRHIAVENRGKTVLVPSHGGSRMEVTLLALLQDNYPHSRENVVAGLHDQIRLVHRCEIVEVVFTMSLHGKIEIRRLTDEDLGLASGPIQHGEAPESTDTGDRVAQPAPTTGPCPKGCL